MSLRINEKLQTFDKTGFMMQVEYLADEVFNTIIYFPGIAKIEM